MNFEEFLKPSAETQAESAPENVAAATEAPVAAAGAQVEAEEDGVVDEAHELNVQKAVVESLAADKAEQDEHIANLRRENYAMKSEISSLNEKIDEMKKALEQVGDVLARNSETPLSSKVTLLERNSELQDRYPGETRDHVIEVLREARDAAEKDGRVRRAQILESVLVDNEPSGELQKRRQELEKLFSDNQNILSGPVIAELARQNIAHKHGEGYLLPSEIVARNY